MSVSSIRNASKPSAALLILGSLLVVVVVAALSLVGVYNHLVSLDQAVQSQWGQVESSYQRRADLIPNLVATVKGAANFEKSTYIAVAEARSKVGQLNVKGASVPSDPAAFAKFASAQDGLSSALSRLLVVSENYPDLKASQHFADLQAQLEGTENRISVERMRLAGAAVECPASAASPAAAAALVAAERAGDGDDATSSRGG